MKCTIGILPIWIKKWMSIKWRCTNMMVNLLLNISLRTISFDYWQIDTITTSTLYNSFKKWTYTVVCITHSYSYFVKYSKQCFALFKRILHISFNRHRTLINTNNNVFLSWLKSIHFIWAVIIQQNR